MRIAEIFLDDFGTKFRLDCKQDLSAASLVKIFAYHDELEEPIEMVYAGHEDTTRAITYRTESDLPLLGLWRIQPRVFFPGAPPGGFRGKPMFVLILAPGAPTRPRRP